jgi:hypothetical protein
MPRLPLQVAPADAGRRASGDEGGLNFGLNRPGAIGSSGARLPTAARPRGKGTSPAAGELAAAGDLAGRGGARLCRTHRPAVGTAVSLRGARRGGVCYCVARRRGRGSEARWGGGGV